MPPWSLTIRSTSGSCHQPLKDEYGNTYLYADEDMRLRLETKLIHSIVTGFEVLPV